MESQTTSNFNGLQCSTLNPSAKAAVLFRLSLSYSTFFSPHKTIFPTLILNRMTTSISRCEYTYNFAVNWPQVSTRFNSPPPPTHRLIPQRCWNSEVDNDVCFTNWSSGIQMIFPKWYTCCVCRLYGSQTVVNSPAVFAARAMISECSEV